VPDTSQAAVPEDILAEIEGLGAEDDFADVLGDGVSPADGEFAAPEDGEGEGDLPAEEEEVVEEEVPEETEEEGDENLPVVDPRQQRIRQAVEGAKRAQKYGDILDMLEEDPNLARELIGRKLGLVPARTEQPASQAPATQPAAQPQWTEEQKSAYWNREYTRDPAGTIARIWDLKEEARQQAAQAEAEPQRNATFATVVRSFKSDMRDATSGDPQWQYYETYFDEALKSADKRLILAKPDETLAFIRDLAYGRWVRDQRIRLKKAQAGQAPASKRETPRNRLTIGGGNRPTGRQNARPSRPMNDEERLLADRYGWDLVSPDENEPQSAWR